MKIRGCPLRIFLLGALLLALPATLQAQFNFITNNGTITITSYTGSNGIVSVPGSTNGLTVTSIGNGAFSTGYTYTGLTNVTIPNSITNIGATAFAFCTSLTNITLGSGVISLGDYAFAYSGLKNLTLPGSLTGIGAYALSGGSLVTITIPGSVTNIGIKAFDACASLTNITVNAADGYYSSLSGVLFNKNQTTLIQYPSGNTTANYLVPSTVTNLGVDAFSQCLLAGVTLSNSVVSIGDNAFYGCNRLTNFTVSAQNTSYSSLNGVLFDKHQTTLIQYPLGNAATTYAVPGSVYSIASYAFAGCRLVSVIIPYGVGIIGTNAFNDSSSLASVKLGGSITSIQDGAFQSCTSLTNLVVPGSVASIGNYAFDYCTLLAGIYFYGNAPAASSTTFGSDTATAYYLPGTTGWTTAYGGLTTAVWALPYPLILNNGGNFGVLTNRFGFTISWATNLSVVVQACTNLVNPVWTPVATNALAGGATYFSDSKWTNYRARYYRVNGP